MKNKKLYKILFAGTALGLLAGILYQYLSTKKDEHDYPVPGKLVDIGGYSLHINCSGNAKVGQPTVVLDAGLGGYSLDWVQIQSEVAEFARVCSFDRAGYGWSDQSPKPRTSEHIVHELHELLAKAEEESPVIMVGHSFGGINVRMFANKFPDKIAGIVLVDASHEDQSDMLPKAPSRDITKILLDHPRLLTFFAHIGLARLFQQIWPLNGLPVDIKKMYIAKTSTTKFIQAVSLEYENFDQSLSQLKSAKTNKPELGNKPLTVITAGRSRFQDGMNKEWEEWSQKMDQVWNVLQQNLVTKSINGKQIFAKESGHLIPHDQPKIIIEAIKEILN